MPPSAPALKFRTPDVRYTSTIPSATSAVSDPVAAPSSTKRNADWLHSAVASITTRSIPLTTRGRREADGQVLDAADQRDAHRLERHGVTDDLDVGQAREQLPERDRDLAASEVRAEAEVRSRPTEADVRVGIAQHVEAFGVVEHARVTVGDAVEQHDLVAFRELVVADASWPSSRCAA